MKSSLKWMVVFIAMAGTLLTACRKDPATRPEPVEKNLVVQLPDDFVSINEVDSAIVVLQKQGSGNPYLQRLVKNADRLHTSIDGLPAGVWTASFEVYTKKLPNGKSFQYVAEKVFTVTAGSGSVQIDGPPAQGGNGWKQRLVFAGITNDLIVIIPMDVTDPYFEIRSPDPAMDYFFIERTAFAGNAVVALKQWHCEQDCSGAGHLITDSTYFKPFTDKIKNEAWTSNEIIITVGNLAGSEFKDFLFTWHQ